MADLSGHLVADKSGNAALTGFTEWCSIEVVFRRTATDELR